MQVLKKLIVFLAIICISLTSFAQPDAESIPDEPEQELLVGSFDRIDLQQGYFSTYFFDEYVNYSPCIKTLEKIESRLFNSSITIILGTWCHDSQQQVPRFMKILDNLDYNTNYLKIICVDRNKTAGDIELTGLDIQRVPTFIFYEKGDEIGRIIETPQLTLEKDIRNILDK